MGGRHYDPHLGRFASPDPVVAAPTFSQSYDPFAYVFNDPLTFTDPSGFEPDDGWFDDEGPGEGGDGSGNRHLSAGGIVLSPYRDGEDCGGVCEGDEGWEAIAAALNGEDGNSPDPDGEKEEDSPGDRDGSSGLAAGPDYEAFMDQLGWWDGEGPDSAPEMDLDWGDIAYEGLAFVPVVGGVIDVYETGKAAYNGDWAGAAMGVAGIASSLIPPAKWAMRGAKVARKVARVGRRAAKGGRRNRPFAMGIREHLQDFANEHGADTWKQLDDPVNWKAGVLDKLGDPNQRVLFNMKGVDAWPGATRAAGGRGGATDWELLQIQQNNFPNLEFWEDGMQVANPFR